MSTDAMAANEAAAETARPTMEVDIACVGFGPAMGGFLTTLTRAWKERPDDPAFASQVAPGMPLQVLCYERADDIAAGVSGVVTRAQGIRETIPELNPAEIPMAAAVTEERVLYLLDPIAASRRSWALRLGDFLLRALDRWAWRVDDARSSCHGRRAFYASTVDWCCRWGSSTSGSAAQLMATGWCRFGRECR